jgi:hypothetical protein
MPIVGREPLEAIARSGCRATSGAGGANPDSAAFSLAEPRGYSLAASPQWPAPGQPQAVSRAQPRRRSGVAAGAERLGLRGAGALGQLCALVSRVHGALPFRVRTVRATPS